MVDEYSKDMIDLIEIKKELIKSMLNKYTDDNLTNEDYKKFYKYLNLQLKDNTSNWNIKFSFKKFLGSI